MSVFDFNLGLLLKKRPDADRVSAARRLKNIEWPVNRKAKVCEVTVNFGCNNRCLFCYNSKEDLKRADETGFREICAALYEGRKENCWIAAVIGGEPTLRKDIDKIALFARKAGYECVKLCTNGLKLADKNYARRLRESGFNMFDISIHGHDARIHDKLVNRKGAFSKVMKAIENVQSLGGEVGTNQVVNALNLKTFPEFFSLAWDEIGINYYNIIYAHYRGMMDKNKNRLKVNLTKAAKRVAEGLRIINERRMPVFSRMLVNFPPCVLPGYLNIIADWESDEEKGDPLLAPDGERLNMAEMKNKQAVKMKVCRRCVLNGECRGIDGEYAQLYGEKEFKPLKSVGKNLFKTVF